MFTLLGSPPHTRGTLVVRSADRDKSRITPAYAGNTLQCIFHLCQCRDHPRIRGEHVSPLKDISISIGSPPHTRGTLCIQHFRLISVGITPAYAGNTMYPAFPPYLRRDHPRIRGEHSKMILKIFDVLGSPPHTRGTRLRHFIRRLSHRITPAYAGNTSLYIPCHLLHWDHPRIRGEHHCQAYPESSFEGSPPHTRGTPFTLLSPQNHSGITPAYAGNTVKRSRRKAIPDYISP